MHLASMGLADGGPVRASARLAAASRRAAAALAGAVAIVVAISVAIVVAIVVAPPRAFAQTDAAVDPVLLVEVGAHAAPIRRVAVDVARRQVLTASDDRSARVWSLDTGALLQTLRPPVSGTRIGRMYGAALHPTRPIAAVAGTTGDGAAGPHSIYLFDVESGRMQRRIDARAGDVKRLAWSADGTVLLATYAGANGVRAFGEDGALLFEHAFRAPSYGLSVAPTGTVAAAALSGEVLVMKVAAGRVEPTGRFDAPTRQPVGIALSPDGRRLALGSFAGRESMRGADAPTATRTGAASVDLLDATTGARLRTLAAPQLDEGNLMTVAWSPDGRTVYAGGTGYRGDRAFVVARYDAESGRAGGEVVVASDSVQDLAPLPDGRLVFASFDGSWGVVAGAAVARFGSPAVDYVRGHDRLSLSADGRRVRWRPGLESAALEYDFDRRTLSPAASADPLPIAPTPGPDSRRGEWMNTARPTFDGRAVPIEAGEVVRAMAQLRGSPDRLYGTSFALMRVRPDGSVAWRRPLDAETRAIVAGAGAGGTLAVGAMSDGTIRWWRLADGEPVLSLLGTRDRRWIVWSPRGFYDASPAADRLAGWAVSRGVDRESDFYSLNRFRDRFNRPDVIDRLLSTGDPQAAVAEADRQAARMREPVPEPQVVLAAVPPGAPPSPPAAVPPAATPPAATPPAAAAQPAASPPAATPPAARPPAARPPAATPPAAPPVSAPSTLPPPVAAPPAAVPPPATPPVAPPPVATTPIPPPSVAASVPLEPPPVVAAPPRPPTPVAPPRVAELPPALAPVGGRVLSVDGEEVSLPFAVRTADGHGEVVIEVRVDGRPVRPEAVVLPKSFDGDARGLARIRVDAPQALVQLFARNREGVSEPLDFRVERVRPPSPAPAAPPARRPTLHVLAIGVSEYRRPEYRLALAAKDANDFAEAMRSQAGKRYGDVVVRVLTDRDATRTRILSHLQWLSSAGGPNDVTMLFVAGHGLNEPGGQYYFLPHDGQDERLRSTGVPESAIRDALARIRGRAIFFIDTCFSGKVLGENRAAGREVSRLANELASSENGVIVFAASTGRQESIEIDSLGNGAFTKAVIEGFRGAADFRRSGRVTYKQLDAFVSDEVARLTQGRQTPVTNIPVGIPDFEIARITL